LELSATGLRLQVDTPWGGGQLAAPLLGRFNACNMLAVLGVLLLRGVPLPEAFARLGRLTPVVGRMQRYGGGEHPLVVVDYAHSPDALEQVLRALREHCRAKLWCVFGCGGERDRGKRPLMGRIAEQLADHVVLTDDNPRREDPWDVIQDIQRGLERPDAAYVQREREAAIALALERASAGDVVLVAGKGHETYQWIGSEKRPFDDGAVVARLLGRS
jgi:UDP-N-acetylmuramoyl-L-alanyl-D-glutamate--2,6-diaminopimelate ligase